MNQPSPGSTSPLPSFFLLTKSSGDVQGHFRITLFAVSGKGIPVKIIIDNFRPLFFVHRDLPDTETCLVQERKPLALQNMSSKPVDCLYFQSYAAALQCFRSLKEKGQQTFEADIHPLDRFLMERMVKGGFSVQGNASREKPIITYKNPRIRGIDISVSLRVLSLDLESNGLSGEIYSIACSGAAKRVFIVGQQPTHSPQDTDADADIYVVYCKHEKQLLETFITYLKKEDPDIIIGWNIINFDLFLLQQRCALLAVPFELGRDLGTTLIPKKTGSRQYIAIIPGRVVFDVPIMLRVNQYTFDYYSLNHVAEKMLGKRKIIEKTGKEKIAEINRLFQEDKPKLIAYNIDDTILTQEIFRKANLLANAIERSKHSGMLLDQYGGSIASFDYLYLPLFHRAGFVAGNVEDIQNPLAPLSGGYVMDSKPGIYENVILLDFKSLYPTIILTFLIDPLGYILPSQNNKKGPSGHAFSSENYILPHLINDLLKARQEAKQQHNQPLSYAIKILMNSFYGVLGSPGCRFFSPNLASAITETGQYILKTTRSYIEQHTDYSVIYGDTDSLFVLLGKNFASQAEEIGNNLAREITLWLQDYLRNQFTVESALELEFESHFRYFFMPTVRSGIHGSKKRYCGTIEKNGTVTLMFKGLESVRSDWTDLAKEYQHTLYLKVFHQEPYEDYILSMVNKVKTGTLDSKLVYRKQLRKPIHTYTVNIPPHVQAAKLLDQPERIIRYIITINGPQPLEKLTAPIDYDHYIECQLKPITDSILEWSNKNFDTIVSGQQNLFG